MNVTRDVINDLLPAYFSGDASADTCRLVDEYFRQDPAFAEEARRAVTALQAIPAVGTVQPDSRIEKAALKRTKRLLRIQTILLALAFTFSLNVVTLGFSIELDNGHTRVHWLALPGQLELIFVILALAIITWTLYFLARHRVRTRVLG